MLFSTNREPTNVVLPNGLRSAVLAHAQSQGVPHAKLMASWLQAYCAEQLKRPEVLYRAALLLARYIMGKRRDDTRPSLIRVRDGEHSGLLLPLPIELRWFAQLVAAVQEKNFSAFVAEACQAAAELQPRLLAAQEDYPKNVHFLVSARGAFHPSGPNGSGEPVA